MRNWFINNKKIVKRLAVYALMTISVIFMVTFIFFFVLGFRFDSDQGKIVRYAFLQFNSKPSGAVVAVDGRAVGSKTPDKTSVPAGKYEITMLRDGYDEWRKSVDLKEGTITWLNYALLVPSNLVVEKVLDYPLMYMSLASPEGRSMIIQQSASMPTFNLVDLNSDTVKSATLTIPTNMYSHSVDAGAANIFSILSWDKGGRYVLVNHKYANNEEWLVVDTQDVSLTKNITKIFNISINDAHFSGSNSKDLYILSQSDIRKLDLSAGTISRPLVSNAISFDVYEKTNIITYTGIDLTSASKKVVGLYRDGDDFSHVLRTGTAPDSNLHIATTRYFSDNYVAISDGKRVDILSGSYPNTVNDNQVSMKVVASFVSDEDVRTLSFSPTGQYVLVQSGSYFASYDLEYQRFESSNVDNASEFVSLKWLDDNYLWNDLGGELTIREFDGANIHAINSVAAGQDALLTHNEKYIYSIGQTAAGYQLQRMLMVLP
jgi:hypothetical protein